MTDERRKELFDSALFWITSHIHDDDEIYNSLHNVIGMTDFEIVDCGIDYLSEYFTDRPNKTMLFSKVTLTADNGSTDEFLCSGIVNSEGGLKLGGNGSTLNAFTAYIAGPALPNHAPRLRVAYVDEDGTATFIDGLPEDDGVQEETVAVYGPDGQRRNRMQRGVNIVRFADGTTRKVQY